MLTGFTTEKEQNKSHHVIEACFYETVYFLHHVSRLNSAEKSQFTYINKNIKEEENYCDNVVLKQCMTIAFFQSAGHQLLLEWLHIIFPPNSQQLGKKRRYCYWVFLFCFDLHVFFVCVWR